LSCEWEQEALEDISHAVLDPLLPLYEFQEALSPITGRIDQALLKSLQVGPICIHI
jgi:hypothetical protein